MLKNNDKIFVNKFIHYRKIIFCKFYKGIAESSLKLTLFGLFNRRI